MMRKLLVRSMLTAFTCIMNWLVLKSLFSKCLNVKIQFYFIFWECQVHPDLSRQLLKDGYHLDEIPDDEDLDLIPPKALTPSVCCCSDTSSCCVQWSNLQPQHWTLCHNLSLLKNSLVDMLHFFEVIFACKTHIYLEILKIIYFICHSSVVTPSVPVYFKENMSDVYLFTSQLWQIG